ncbi:MAG: serine hydrolase domain-containing protein [Parasphingopyxis sp.]|uniref:serine hydrolase domain-containing protein n=1 Tax=Parasphingopyxis sp. TaxID=1920299 RepID=UPI0032F00358
MGRAESCRWRSVGRNTISVVWSTTKGIVAIAVHHAVEQGLIDLDAPIAKYWPEFACEGKERATVAMILDHSVGVPALRDPVTPGGFADFDYMCGRVACERPLWEPGTRHGYHGHTYAWTVGGLFRRAVGVPLGKYIRSEIAEPLNADFWLGLPAEEHHRGAPMIYPTDPLFGGKSLANHAIENDPAAPFTLMMTNDGGYDCNDSVYWPVEIGSLNGMTNARGLATIYSALANGDLLAPDTVARMGRTSSASHMDATLLMPMRFGLGFMKTTDNRRQPELVDCTLLMSAEAFGHVGFGGSIGFADPGPRMAFAYTMNRMGAGVMVGERAQLLIDATYRALGFSSNSSGAWVHLAK